MHDPRDETIKDARCGGRGNRGGLETRGGLGSAGRIGGEWRTLSIGDDKPIVRIGGAPVFCSFTALRDRRERWVRLFPVLQEKPANQRPCSASQGAGLPL
jgi:hypothetical protein